MRARMASLLVAALLALTPLFAQARVHRRSVGPVILDLGPLPPPPALPGPILPEHPAPAVDLPNNPSSPKPQTASEMNETATTPTPEALVYPTHTQPLGALVVAIHTHTAIGDEVIAVMTSPPPAAIQDIPTLVAHHHPTLAEDHALLAPPPAASISSPPPPGPSKADQPLPRLRGAVIWIWRLLFLGGFGAMVVLFQRYRSRIKSQTTPKASQQASVPEPTNSQLIASSRIMRATRSTQTPAADSLSLLTGKQQAIEQTSSAPKDFGLIEPGQAKPLRTPGGST